MDLSGGWFFSVMNDAKSYYFEKLLTILRCYINTNCFLCITALLGFLSRLLKNLSSWFHLLPVLYLPCLPFLSNRVFPGSVEFPMYKPLRVIGHHVGPDLPSKSLKTIKKKTTKNKLQV